MIGAGAMILGGIAGLLFGIKAEGLGLERIARPLTAAARSHRKRSAPEAASV